MSLGLDSCPRALQYALDGGAAEAEEVLIAAGAGGGGGGGGGGRGAPLGAPSEDMGDLAAAFPWPDQSWWKPDEWGQPNVWRLVTAAVVGIFVIRALYAFVDEYTKYNSLRHLRR